MAGPEKSVRRLVLVGAGHAHLFVLEQLAAGRFPAADVTLLSPYAQHLYSGMLGGLVAGRYRREDAYLDLPALAAQANARFVVGSAVQVDRVSRQISVNSGEKLPYDIASFAIGSGTSRSHARAGDPALAVKPIDQAGAIAQALDRLEQTSPTVIVIGGGAGGVEIALNIKTRLRVSSRVGATVVLVGRQSRLVADRSMAAGREAARVLLQHHIQVVLGREVEKVGTTTVYLSDGTQLGYDLVVWASGAAAPELFRESGLKTDDAGFLLVDETLRSIADPAIFAAGDAATLCHAPTTPKSGVYAVRQGPILARNLSLALRGAHPRRLRHYRPQSRSLVLINTGDGRAILSYGPLAVTAHWVMRLKDRIDRSFMRRFQRRSAS